MILEAERPHDYLVCTIDHGMAGGKPITTGGKSIRWIEDFEC